MPSTLLICTSPKITPELVREVQLADPTWPIASPYVPALAAAEDQHRPSRTVPEDKFDLFEGYTDPQLQDFYVQRQREVGNWIESGSFVVLDERGVGTKTVVLHSFQNYFNENGDKIDLPGRWVTCRVYFADACEMIGQFMAGTEGIDQVYLRAEQWTDSDGIFQLQKALLETGWNLTPGQDAAQDPACHTLGWSTDLKRRGVIS